MLVMWRKIVSYNSSVLVVNVEIMDGCALVQLSDFIYEPHSSSFVLNTQKKQSIQSLNTRDGLNIISCLGCKVILDDCGVYLPYFVAQDSAQCYFFSLDSRNEWLMKYNFMIPKVEGRSVKLYDTSLYIENGPTLIWTMGCKIHIYKGAHSIDIVSVGSLRSPMDLLAHQHLEVFSSILFWWSNVNSEQGMVVLKDSKGSIVNSYIITVDNEKRRASMVNQKIIPFVYLSITSCCVAIPQDLLSNENALNEDSYRVLISTTQKQLLEFSNAKFIKHVNIPLSSCQEIQVFESAKDCLILLCLEEDQVCAVDWTNSKILKNWQAFSEVLVDDFIGLGSLQTLLLQAPKSDKIIDNFVLIDFCKTNVDNTIENKARDGLLSTSRCIDAKNQSIENSNNVVNALMKKVQVEQVSINECEMEKSEKISFVKRHCESLRKMLLEESNPTISGLAPLVTSQEVNSKELEVQTLKVILRSKWNEITSTGWTIGVKVENVGIRPISEVTLSAVNKASGIVISSSKIICSTKVKTKKREKQALSSGQQATLLSFTSFPSFSLETPFSVSLMLTFKDENNEHLSQICGILSLDMEDIVNMTTTNCKHVALYPLKTQLLLSSGSYDINNLKDILNSSMECCVLHGSYPQTYHMKHPLGTTHVSWTRADKALTMDIFTRDYNELLLCLRLLKQQLPDDSALSPMGVKLTVELALISIKKEISSRIDKLEKLLETQSIMAVEESQNSLSVEEPQAQSEETTTKRRKVSLHYHGSQTVNSTACRKIFADIFKYLVNTNNLLLKILFFLINENVR